MTSEVKLSRLRSVTGELAFPASSEDVRVELSGVTVLFADGEEALSTVVSRSNADTFESVDDLDAEIYANLPVEAVGEPGQSEGEG